jgi:diaminopimelate epimerase
VGSIRGLPFIKMHGRGNDFILVDEAALGGGTDLPALARKLCDRHFGIGADGLILVAPSRRPGCALRLRIFNPDGSEAEMCGNGMRCLALYARERGLVKEDAFGVETLAGVIRPAFQPDGTVQVDMGAPELRRSRIPMLGTESERVVGEELVVDGRAFSVTAVNMGNPHCVVFEDALTDEEFLRFGPQIERERRFPNGTNVEFVCVYNRGHLGVRVWERGAGPTLACGTGACAVAVAGVLNGLAERAVRVSLPGGDLEVVWREDTAHVLLAGPAEKVFWGHVLIEG